MAFATADFKKTSRKSGDGRQIYPYQIRDDRYTAAIGYAIAYYERMVSRRRAEFEADTLLEFFGDPKLARGLVACLARTYVWREQRFGEALGPEVAQTLHNAEIATPADMRARLYGLANGRYGGVILPAERPEALAFLCERINEQATAKAASNAPTLPVKPEHVERALILDSEDQRVLVKQGPMPEPKELVARYNYHSLETAICHAETLQLQLRGQVWNIMRSVHNLARRYRLRYEVIGGPRTLFDEQIDVVIHGHRDALGNWTRAGRRVARVLLRLLAAHPDTLRNGIALVHVGGKASTLVLDDRALSVLGVAAGEQSADGDAWEQDVSELFQRAWSRAYVGRRSAGWRLRRDPEPLIGAGAVLVPDFVLQRGSERQMLCIATGRATAEALVRDLAQLGGRSPVLAVVPGHVAETLRACPVPLATYDEQPSEAIPSLVLMLERRFPRGEHGALTPWQRLERRVAEEGFVGQEDVAVLLGCPEEEALQTVRRWGGTGLHVLPGLGVCTPDAVVDIRQAIEQSDLRQTAA